MADRAAKKVSQEKSGDAKNLEAMRSLIAGVEGWVKNINRRTEILFLPV